VLGLLLRSPHLRFRADRWLRARDLPPLRPDDFPAAPHRLLFEAVLTATEQENRDPQDELVLRLPTELHEEADHCLTATAGLKPDQYAAALLHALLRLRLEQVNRTLDELRFLLASAAEDETTLYQQRLIEAIRHRGLLDRALKAGFHLPTAH
jgi:replicative DNA helicase